MADTDESNAYVGLLEIGDWDTDPAMSTNMIYLS